MAPRRKPQFQPRWEGDFPSLGYQIGPWIERNLGIKLLSEQRERLVRLYRLDPVTGERTIRRAGLRAPKGKGKSPEGGYLGFAELCGPVLFEKWDAEGKPVGRARDARATFTPWIQFAAVSEDQTDNVLVWLFETCRAQEARMTDLGVDLGRTRIYLNGRPGRIEPVTAAAGSREGQPVTFAVLDQTEAWKKENGGVRLANVLRRNIGKTGGWSLELQNAPEPGDGSVADRTSRAWDRGQAGLFFDARIPSKIPELYDRPALLEALAEVYGESALSAGGWVNLERVADECTDADTEPSDAYRFYLNVEWQSEERAFDSEKWAELADPGRIVGAGSFIVVGVDGARYDDALAIVATEIPTGHQFVIGIWERQEHAPDEYEHPTEDVDQMMVDTFDRHNVWRVYIDPGSTRGNIDHLSSRWQGRWGEDRIVSWHMNRPRQVAYAVRKYSSAIRAGDLSHDGDSVMAAHVRHAQKKPNGVKDEEGRPMWTIQKSSSDSPLKIDAAAAGVLAWEARMDALSAGAQPPKKRSRKAVFL